MPTKFEDEFEPHRNQDVITHERGTWSNKIEFLLTCIGYAIGFSNIWRFPFKCYDNGGGAFLFPFFIAVITGGLPLFLMELSLGQYSSLGPIKLFRRLSPAFTGVGIAMVVVSVFVSIYYNMILTWTLFYLFSSFAFKLPWTECDNWWNTPNCYDSYKAQECFRLNLTYANRSCLNTSLALQNLTTRESPALQYFENRMLKISDSLENMGFIQWELLGCLFLAWVLNFLCVMKGIQTSGKVVYFTASFPYIVLVIILIRAVTLPGVSKGLIFYMSPDWGKIFTFKVWEEAYQQVFFSLGPAFGCLMTMASYNDFNHDFYRDGLIVGVLNSATSIFAGFVVFSILGFMAHELDTPVNKVMQSGLGLAFVAYPTAITRLSLAPFWSIIFFFMLVTIGLDSQFAMVETILTCIYDEWHWLRPKKVIVCATLCFVMFLFGIPYTMNGGIYLFQLMDNYSAGWPLLFICLMECIIITFIYGTNRFYSDIETMIGYKICNWWKFCWIAISPTMLIILILIEWGNTSVVSYKSYTFTPLATGIGWFVASSSVLCIPGYMIYEWFVVTRRFYLSGDQISDSPCPLPPKSENKNRESWLRAAFSQSVRRRMFQHNQCKWDRNRTPILPNPLSSDDSKDEVTKFHQTNNGDISAT